MDYGGAVKALPLLTAGILFMLSQSSPDPAALLEQLRDKVIARLPPLGYACVATMDRSFLSSSAPSIAPKSCEQISMDRRNMRIRFQLEKTDRLRLQATVTTDGELYSWTPGPASRNLDEVVNSGDIATGSLAAHLDAILASPLVRFRLLVQNADNLEFGFRIPIGASGYLVKAGEEWRETGYAGSLAVDPASLELKRVTIDTEN
jgi:hypothetical protein